MINILYKLDVLDGVFDKKEYNFLKNIYNKQDELEVEVKMAELKKEQIIEYIKDNENSEKAKKNNHLKSYINNAECAFESINAIILNTRNLLEDFYGIERELLQLIEKRVLNSDEDISTYVSVIQYKIGDLDNRFNNITLENRKYNLVIKNFFDIIENPSNETEKTEEIEKVNTEKINQNLIDQKEKDNLVLRISEHEKIVYLPYTYNEIKEFLENFPEDYEDENDVIKKEFITNISIYNKNPSIARFREAFSLSRNKEMKSVIDSLKFAVEMMFRSDINPAIIAAVKSQNQLENYIECLENNTLDQFKYFKIIFEVNPI